MLDQDVPCMFCLENIKPSQELRLCGCLVHTHPICLQSWIDLNEGQCPLCRKIVTLKVSQDCTFVKIEIRNPVDVVIIPEEEVEQTLSEAPFKVSHIFLLVACLILLSILSYILIIKN